MPRRHEILERLIFKEALPIFAGFLEITQGNFGKAIDVSLCLHIANRITYRIEDISGDPVVISGGVSEGGVTSGPNFSTGRRTWTDIMPE